MNFLDIQMLKESMAQARSRARGEDARMVVSVRPAIGPAVALWYVRPFSGAEGAAVPLGAELVATVMPDGEVVFS